MRCYSAWASRAAWTAGRESATPSGAFPGPDVLQTRGAMSFPVITSTMARAKRTCAREPALGTWKCRQQRRDGQSGSPQPSARDWTTRLWEKGAPERCFCPNSRRLPCGRRLHDRAGPALSRKAAPRQRSRALCGLVRTPSKRNRQEYDAHMVAARELGMKWAMGW